MGMLADSLFAVLMSWVRALVNGIWALFSSENTTVLEFLGKNWITIAVVMIAAGLVLDWMIWLIRWQPYHIWAQRFKRLLRIDRDEPQEEEEYKAHAAVLSDRAQPQIEAAREVYDEDEMENDLYIDEREAQDMMERAEQVPDEELGVYPGMLYGTAAEEKPMGNTQRYSALTVEGPGSAEVARRRAEIDAWQRQIQDEARQRIQAERKAREEEAAEAVRRAEEERLAQEAYARELEAYERRKAQYERELAEYERQKAAYDAQMAQLAAQEQMQQNTMETAQELEPRQGAPARRRRAAAKPYSDYVTAEEVDVLPPAPEWPKKTEIEKTKKAAQKKAAAKAQKEKQPHEHRLLSKVAKIIEPQEDEITSFTALPPRVDMNKAYKPAKMPQKEGGSKR